MNLRRVIDWGWLLSAAVLWLPAGSPLWGGEILTPTQPAAAATGTPPTADAVVLGIPTPRGGSAARPRLLRAPEQVPPGKSETLPPPEKIPPAKGETLPPPEKIPPETGGKSETTDGGKTPADKDTGEDLPDEVLAGPGLPVNLDPALFHVPPGLQPDVYNPIQFPPWRVMPVYRVPYFLGDFVARNLSGSFPASVQLMTASGTDVLTFGAVGPTAGNFVFPGVGSIGTFNNTAFTGPGGFALGAGTVSSLGPLTADPFLGGSFGLLESTALTSAVQSAFPGAVFAGATGALVGTGFDSFNLVYTFNRTLTQVSLPVLNPSGGGAAGRNNFFTNGSAVPRDRVYFFYTPVGGYRVNAGGGKANINRFVFGGEQTFCDNLFSAEVRIPFASTIAATQAEGGLLAADQVAFGNLGLAFKGVIYRYPTFLASIGLGLSVPTAPDSRLLLGNGNTSIDVENNAVLLQPLAGFAWAPTDYFFAQAGFQVDVAAGDNPVNFRGNGQKIPVGGFGDNVNTHTGVGGGYWVYKCPDTTLTALALLSEVHVNQTFGTLQLKQTGGPTVDLPAGNTTVNLAFGATAFFGARTNLQAGVVVPVAQRGYDIGGQIQLNVFLGPPVPWWGCCVPAADGRGCGGCR